MVDAVCRLVSKQLTAVLGYDADAAKQIAKTAKPKYKEIIAKLPELKRVIASN